MSDNATQSSSRPSTDSDTATWQVAAFAALPGALLGGAHAILVGKRRALPSAAAVAANAAVVAALAWSFRPIVERHRGASSHPQINTFLAASLGSYPLCALYGGPRFGGPAALVLGTSTVLVGEAVRWFDTYRERRGREMRAEEIARERGLLVDTSVGPAGFDPAKGQIIPLEILAGEREHELARQDARRRAALLRSGLTLDSDGNVRKGDASDRPSLLPDWLPFRATTDEELKNRQEQMSESVRALTRGERPPA